MNTVMNVKGGMMNFIERILHQTSKSAEVAKDRLHLILTNDRSGISPTTLDILRSEIVNVLSKHVKVDGKNVHVSVMRTAEGNHIIANIPLMEKRSTPEKFTPKRRSRQN